MERIDCLINSGQYLFIEEFNFFDIKYFLARYTQCVSCI